MLKMKVTDRYLVVLNGCFPPNNSDKELHERKCTKILKPRTKLA
jgi:hypothetical protein